MFEYNYTRNFFENINQYDIDYWHPETPEVPLYQKILDQISKRCQIKCNEADCKVYFAEELSPEEQATLDGIVSLHKSSAPWSE